MKTKLRLDLGLAFECKFYMVGPTSHNSKLSIKLYFRVSSIHFLRPGLEAFGRDTGTRDSPTALILVPASQFFISRISQNVDQYSVIQNNKAF